MVSLCLCKAARSFVSSAALISELLFSGRPTEIIRRVWPIIIDAINFEIPGPFSDVSEKIWEIQPSITDDYSPATIAMEGWIFRIVAAIYHCSPYPIKRRIRFSAPNILPSCRSNTSARYEHALPETTDDFFVSTRAFTEPLRRLPIPRSPRNSSNSGQFAMNFARLDPCIFIRHLPLLTINTVSG